MREDMDILLIEDNAQDVEITLRAFNKHHIAGRVHVVRDGEEALECLFCTGRYADRSPCQNTRLILLDLKLPKVDGLEILQTRGQNTYRSWFSRHPGKSRMWREATVTASTATSSSRSIFPNLATPCGSWGSIG